MDELIKDLEKSEQISFPVTFNLKIIMDATIPEQQNIKSIEEVLDGLEIPNKSMGRRLSSSGRYMSFTYEVMIQEHPVLKALYEKLKSLPGIKFAV
jgi:putative lipoic acid-binding regulatory protein